MLGVDRFLIGKPVLLDSLIRGDLFMADRGLDIQESVASKGISENVFPCLES